MTQAYTIKYTGTSSGYMGQLVEWPEVISESTTLDECRTMVEDALHEMILVYKQAHPAGWQSPRTDHRRNLTLDLYKRKAHDSHQAASAIRSNNGQRLLQTSRTRPYLLGQFKIACAARRFMECGSRVHRRLCEGGRRYRFGCLHDRLPKRRRRRLHAPAALHTLLGTVKVELV